MSPRSGCWLSSVRIPPPIKRIVQDSREIGMLIDATYGRKTQAVLIMDTGHAVLSALPPDAVQGRVQASDQETGGDAT